MNQSVLNDIMPSLVPEIAVLAKLPKPIDLFTALGAAVQSVHHLPIPPVLLATPDDTLHRRRDQQLAQQLSNLRLSASSRPSSSNGSR
jgi:hypothetical protein